VIVFWQNVIAVFFFLPLFLVAELNGFLLSGHDPVSYFAILKLGILPSTVSFILFIPVVNFLGAAKANMFTNLIPVITAVFSFFFFNEDFTLLKLVGIGAVIAGLFLSQTKFRNKKLIEVEYV
jgi:drug/metabolite transporter (DMT)-like permease